MLRTACCVGAWETQLRTAVPEDGEIVGDSEHGLAWELGAGLALPLRDRWLVMERGGRRRQRTA